MIFSNLSTRPLRPFLPVSNSLKSPRLLHNLPHPPHLLPPRLNLLILLNQQFKRLSTMLRLCHTPQALRLMTLHQITRPHSQLSQSASSMEVGGGGEGIQIEFWR